MPHPRPLSGVADRAPVGAASLGAVAALVVVLTGIRLFVSGRVGLAADEAYYWTWSNHLALGYFDHPPMIAYLIRASTALFGHTEAGIRALAVLAGALASLGVWRLVFRLTDDARLALAGAAMVQATLFLGVGSLLVTPDTPLVFFWFVALLALVEVWRTGDGRWWLAAGLGIGLAFVSKYTAVFLGFGVILWLSIVPDLRRWFLSPWAYAGGVVCLAVMAPVIAWNLGQEGGASLTKQFGRAVPQAFDPRFVPEFIAGQAALLTPFIGILVVIGLVVCLRDTIMRRDSASVFVTAFTLPLVAYLVWYGLFDRVQGNWTACLIGTSIAAAVMGARQIAGSGIFGSVVAFSWRWSVVAGVALTLLVFAHALFRLAAVPTDPTGQLFGWRQAADMIQVEANARRAGAIGTVQYTTRALLVYYGPGGLPVVQLNERGRYVQEPAPDVERLRGRPILVVVESRRVPAARLALSQAFASVREAGEVPRPWGNLVVDRLSLFLVSGPIGQGFPDIGPAR